MKITLFQQIKTLTLDTLFPISCLRCGAPDVWLCENCLKKIELLSVQVCPQCEQVITTAGEVCLYCKKNAHFDAKIFPLDALVVTVPYKKTGIDKLVHLYKYNFIADLHLPLGQILTKALLRHDLPLVDLILPVPLHRRRLKWRGFNQAELLANYVAENLTPGFPIPVAADILLRKKYTPPQMKIKKYAERQENLKDAFLVQDATQIQGRKILLVDDISTTGTTMLECAKALKLAGAKKVFGVVIARQEME